MKYKEALMLLEKIENQPSLEELHDNLSRLFSSEHEHMLTKQAERISPPSEKLDLL